jgi:hypothetical protein
MQDVPSALAAGPVSIEPPEGWGPRRMLIGRLRDLGYDVTEHIEAGVSVLAITGSRAPRQL